MSVNNIMFSNIIAAFESAIKTETELYQSRLMKQFSHYTGILDLQYRSAHVMPEFHYFGEDNESSGGSALKKLQDDVEMLTKGLDYVMNMIISKNKVEAAEVSCSPYESDSDGEEIHVNKLPSNEIKEVHIETEIPSAPMPTPVIAAEVADIIPAPINISKVADAPVEVEVEVNDNTNPVEVESVDGNDADNEDSEEQEAEEEEEEEAEQGIDVEEFEYKGTSYYKDPEGNVYECLESGEVGEPVGTMSKKIPGKVLFYS